MVPAKKHIFAIAIVGSIITIFGFVMSPQGGIPWVVIANRGLALAAIWMTAFLLALRLNERNRANDEIRTLTELKNAETALGESEEQFRRIFEDSIIGMTITLPDGQFLDVNDAYVQYLGYSKAELRKMAVSDITYSSDVKDTVKDRAAILRGFGPSRFIDKRHIKKNGEVAWGRLNCSVIKDADGEARFIVGQVQDITQSKLAEESLIKSEEQYRRVFERSGVGMAANDFEGNFLRVNSAFCKMLGYSMKEFLTKTVNEITYIDDRATTIESRRTAKPGEFAGRTWIF